MVMGYWSVAILFWQLSIDHIVNVLYKRCGLAKTPLRHPFLPFDSLPYPTRTICRRVRMLGQSRDNQTKRGGPYSMSMGLRPRYKLELTTGIHACIGHESCVNTREFLKDTTVADSHKNVARKSKFTFSQSLSWLFQLSYFLKCKRWLILELNFY